MGQKQKMLSFIELRNKSRQEVMAQKEYRLVVMGNVSTQHLATAVQGYGRYENIKLDVHDVDYDQIDLQLLNDKSEAFRFHPDAFFLFIAAERIYEDFIAETKKDCFAEILFGRILQWWARIESVSGKAILQNTVMEMDDCVYGSFGCKLEKSFIFQIRKLNYLIMSESLKRKEVFLVDFLRLQAMYGRNVLFDNKMYYFGKLVVSTECLPILAKAVVDVIKSILGINKKCIILDLDNTLWGGVVSEVGIKGIEIGALGKGHVFTDFQIWLKELRKRGILLAVCSKNDDTVARMPFLAHSEMILGLDDFAVFVANWDDKASNIKQIQQTLNIGMDSLVFIDDSPFERELVRTMLPDVLVPELPNDPAEYLGFLRDMNLFETTAYSELDADRTEQYQIESKRRKLKDSVETYEEYLRSLRMVADIRPFDEFQTPRISQLTNRSNQFNLRTVRYSEKEIADIMTDPASIGKYVTLKDKFGDYGLVGVIILKQIDSHALFIDTWLMSCRVLERGLEEFVVNRLVDIAREEKMEYLVGEYIETAKNSMVKDLYKRLGFERYKESMWILPVGGYRPQANYMNQKE